MSTDKKPALVTGVLARAEDDKQAQQIIAAAKAAGYDLVHADGSNVVGTLQVPADVHKALMHGTRTGYSIGCRVAREGDLSL